ncbi:MAG: ATP-grasp domain-containing protein [Lachnospiraceae bacterium]|nr:ATP-grasp domain-containing protein [Lachnospiraceae bacterium]
MKTVETVLVTAIGSFSSGAVIASCRREGYRVIGCDIYPAEWVASSLDVEVFAQAPYATDVEHYRTFLQALCAREQVSLLIPSTDVEVDALQRWGEEADLSEQLPGVTICMPGHDTVALCRNKEKTEHFLAERGLCRTIPGRRLSEVAEQETAKQSACPESALSYPRVIKPIDGRSSQGLMIVENPEQFASAVKRCRQDAAGLDRYLVQPKLEGMVVTVDVVRDPESGECVCLPRRELLRTLNGAGTSVHVFRDEVLEAQCRGIAGALDIRGCVNFEFIEAGPSEWYFLECNPRFAGGVAFSCAAGYDMVKNHLNCFTGKGIEPRNEVQDQYIARRYTEYRMKEGTTDENKA